MQQLKVTDRHIEFDGFRVACMVELAPPTVMEKFVQVLDKYDPETYDELEQQHTELEEQVVSLKYRLAEAEEVLLSAMNTIQSWLRKHDQ